MKEHLRKVIKDEKGYGTVELLLIVAGLGLLATALFKALQINLVVGDGDNDSTVNQVTEGVNDLIDGWLTEGTD